MSGRVTQLILVCAALLAGGPVAAARPTLTYFFPAGAQQGKTITITAGGTFPRWPVRAWVDGHGVTVQAALDKGKLSVTVAADAAPGTYWIRLYDDQGASSPRPFLVGSLPEVLEQEPNDDPREPQVLDGLPVTVNGRLSKPEDVDGFAVKLRKGQTLVASLEANCTLGSPMDAVLQILSSDGFVLDQNNDYHDLDPQIVFVVPRDGTYIVRTFAFPATPDSSIRFTGSELCIYRLTLTTGGFVDHAFPLAVARSEPATVALVGWNIPEAARQPPVGKADDHGLVALTHPALANVVWVRREPRATVVKVAPADRQHPQRLTLPVTVSGRIETPGVHHVYQFDAQKGQKLSLRLESRTLGFPLDALLRLTDEGNQTLARGEGGGRRGDLADPEIAFTVPKDGIYRLEVSDLHDDGGLRYVYRLTARLAEPDFALTLAADHFEMTAGKPLDIPVAIERRDGFAGDVEVAIEGLPKGVQAAPVHAGATAKSVTLRLSAASDPISAPFRVVGKVGGQEDRTRMATAAIPGLTASTTHVWLTVAPAGTDKPGPKR